MDSSLQERLQLNYFYDENDLVEEIIFTRNNFETQQIQRTKQLYIYDVNNNVQEIVLYNIDENNTEEIIQRREFTYDTTERLENVLAYNIVDNMEELSYRVFYTYEDQGKKVFSVFEIFNNELVTETRREELSFDDFGNLISKINETDGSSLVLTTEYDYNTESTRDDLIFPYSSGFAPNPTSFLRQENQLLSFGRKTNINTQVDLTLYYWSEREATTSLSDTPIADLKIYPNPVGSVMFVENIDLEADLFLNVYNLQGIKIVSRELLDVKQAIDMSILSSGAYFFTLNDADHILYKGKFIKE